MARRRVWKSTNAANNLATDVAWTPVTDDQATLSVGSIAVQPGNGKPAKSLILVGRGEANNAGDSYFGLGILRSTDAGNTWSLISTANAGHGRSDRQQRLQVIYRRQMGWDRSMVHLRRRAAAMFGSRPMLRRERLIFRSDSGHQSQPVSDFERWYGFGG